MNLLPPKKETRPGSPNELETIALSGKHLDYLGQIALEMNPGIEWNKVGSTSLTHAVKKTLPVWPQGGFAGKRRQRAGEPRGLTSGFFLRRQQLDDLIDRVCL
jgi:hypothetical protein